MWICLILRPAPLVGSVQHFPTGVGGRGFVQVQTSVLCTDDVYVRWGMVVLREQKRVGDVTVVADMISGR